MKKFNILRPGHIEQAVRNVTANPGITGSSPWPGTVLHVYTYGNFNREITVNA